MKTHEMFDKINDPGPGQGKLVQNKSQLAKLMATENITIRHRQIKTPKFDMAKRILHCPIWKDMTGDIYDLLMGHEISHALNTPLEGWHDTIVNDKVRPTIKKFLNVCEDARIEKLIKRKYPGIRKPFSRAYHSLFERGFFGKHEELLQNINTLGLIDRINLRFKVGAHLNVEFDKEEQVFVDRAENMETFEDVIQLARDIYDYQKFNEPEKKKKKSKDDKDKKSKDGKSKSKKDESKSEKPKKSDDANDSDDQDESDGTDESDAPEGDESADVDEGEGDDSDGGESADEDQSQTSSSDAGRNPEEPTSSTDDAFRKEEEKLLDTFGPGQLYMNMPQVDLKKVIIPHKVVVAKYEEGIRSAMMGSGIPGLKMIPPMNYDVMASALNKSFEIRNRGFVSMLVKEFEMRKNASQYSRQLTAKTGELDDKKIARYKLTSDIFRKVTTITKGKSHGMIMFLDFSGSMSMTIRDILEQVLVLVTFCKRVGIPFDVYGFGDSHNYSWSHYDCFKVVNDSYTFTPDKFHLRHLISSNLKGNAYKRAFTMLNVVAQITNNIERLPDIKAIFNKPDYRIELNSLGFGLGGTPFLETLTASMYVIQKFKEDHHVDITNVIYLSDGDGSDSFEHNKEYQAMAFNESRNTTIGFQDHRTKIKVLANDKTNVPYQTALTRLVAMVTGCRHIGYFFGSEMEIKSKIKANRNLKDHPKHIQFLADNGFVAVPNLGYDNYYYVNKDQIAYKGELKFYPGTSTDLIGDKFIEHQKKKMNSKLISKQFAQDVAE